MIDQMFREIPVSKAIELYEQGTHKFYYYNQTYGREGGPIMNRKARAYRAALKGDSEICRLKTVNYFGPTNAAMKGSKFGALCAPVEMIRFIARNCYDGKDTPYFDTQSFYAAALERSHEWYTNGPGKYGENLYEVVKKEAVDLQIYKITWEPPADMSEWK